MSKRKWNTQELIQAVRTNEHITDVLKKLGLRHSSLNAKTIKKYIEEYKLDTSHWKGQITRQRRVGHESSVSEVFVANSTFTRSHLKEKILKYNLLPYKCAECVSEPKWNDKLLTLQLDHINGINTDHRIENLRFLCPNCHSQTPNYAGANALNRKKAEIFTCKQCGNYRSSVSKSELCVRCISTRDKICWPDDKTLFEMVCQSNINQVSKQLNVSYPGLKKRLKRRNLMNVDWMAKINNAQPVWEHGYNTYIIIDDNLRVCVFAEGKFSLPMGTGISRLGDYDLVSVCIYEKQRSKYSGHSMLHQVINPSKTENAQFKNYNWKKYWTPKSPSAMVSPLILCEILKDIDQLNRLKIFR